MFSSCSAPQSNSIKGFVTSHLDEKEIVLIIEISDIATIGAIVFGINNPSNKPDFNIGLGEVTAV